jgi:hypothetical protein
MAAKFGYVSKVTFTLPRTAGGHCLLAISLIPLAFMGIFHGLIGLAWAKSNFIMSPVSVDPADVFSPWMFDLVWTSVIALMMSPFAMLLATRVAKCPRAFRLQCNCCYVFGCCAIVMVYATTPWLDWYFAN